MVNKVKPNAMCRCIVMWSYGCHHSPSCEVVLLKLRAVNAVLLYYSDQHPQERTHIINKSVQVMLFNVMVHARTSVWRRVLIQFICLVKVTVLQCYKAFQWKETLHFLMRHLLWNICRNMLRKGISITVLVAHYQTGL